MHIHVGWRHLSPPFYLLTPALYANDIQQYQECFVNRLDALAHCHDLLVRDNWQGAPLHDLVMAQMKPFNETNSNRITKVRNIRLTDAADGHNIACKIEGIGTINLKSEFVKKA